MRIRSIKPEFWRSQSISSLDWETRFIFIGLWSYVDDNGVGIDRVSLVTADLFADDLERDPRETFARVSRGLQNLSETGRIRRYTVAGKGYLEIVGWSEHQRIDKPNKPRYPTSTSDNAEIRESVASVSRDIRESPSTGAEEQGNRGTGELSFGSVESDSYVAGRGVSATPGADIVREIIPKGHPPATLTSLRIQASELLNTGTDRDTVRAALELWRDKPSVGNGRTILASLCSEVIKSRTAPARTTAGRPSGQDAKVNGYLALANIHPEQNGLTA